MAGPTTVAEVCNGQVKKYEVEPATFGKSIAPIGAIRGGSVEENAESIRRILQSGGTSSDREQARRDVVAINAAAALAAAGVESDLLAGTKKAEQAIISGAAAAKLAELREFAGN